MYELNPDAFMAIRITLLQLFVSQLGLVFDNLPEKMLVRLNQPDCQLKDYFVQVLPLSYLAYPWIIHQPDFVKSQPQPSFYLTDTKQPVVPIALPFDCTLQFQNHPASN